MIEFWTDVCFEESNSNKSRIDKVAIINISKNCFYVLFEILLPMVYPTDYAHTKAKSLILYSPNSNHNPK